MVPDHSNTESVGFEPTHKQKGKALMMLLEENCLNEEMNKEVGGMNTVIQINVGNLDLTILQLAYMSLLYRHESLRTTFLWLGGSVRQKVHELHNLQIDIDLLDLSGQAEGSFDEITVSWLQADFDLFREIPIRVHAVKVPGGHFSVYVVVNKVVCDYSSTNILKADLINLYKACHETKQVVISAPSHQMKDFAAVEKELCIPGGQHELYWKKELSGAVPTHVLRNKYSTSAPISTDTYEEGIKRELAVNYRNVSTANSQALMGVVHRATTFKGSKYRFTIGPELYKVLKRSTVAFKSTVFSTIVASSILMLHKISKLDTVMVGVEVSLRDGKWEHVVGWLTNTILLRIDIDKDSDVTRFTGSVAQKLFECFEFKEFPMERVLHQTNLSLDLIGTLYLNFLYNYPGKGSLENWEPHVLDDGLPYFNLDCTMSEYSNGIEVVFRYKVDLFTLETIKEIADMMVRTLSQMVSTPHDTINNIVKKLPGQ